MTPFLFNQVLELLALADALAGDFTGSLMKLYTNNLVFDPATVVVGDLTEATFTGYVSQTLVWGVPSVSDDNHVESISGQLTWRPTDAVTPELVYGYYWTTLGGALLGGGYFDEGPLPMQSALDVMKTTLIFRFGNDGYCSVVS